MSIFIPYNPESETTGNPIIPHPDFVSAGEQLRVKTTGSYSGAVDVTKTADASLIEALAVNRAPIYAAFFAASKGDRETWGTASVDFRKTPTSGFDDSSTNGRLAYTDQLKDRALGAAKDASAPFSRVLIGNPGGYSAGKPLDGSEDGQGYFPANAGSLMSTSSVDTFQLDGTTLHAVYNTPYTDTGLAGGVVGDTVASWSAALDSLRDSGYTSEIFAYVGYGWAYTDDTHTTVDYNLAAYAPSWSRSVKEPQVYPVDSLQIEWDILKTAGFDNMSFDAGTRVAEYNDAGDTFAFGAKRIADIRNTINPSTQQIYEALPRTVDGGKKDDFHYVSAKHWLLWPTSSGVSTDGTGTTVMGRPNESGNSVVQMDGWGLDTATTEVHVVIDINESLTKGWYGNTSNGSTPNGSIMNWPQFKDLVARTKAEGFIPSCQSWNASGATMSDGQGGTVDASDLVKHIATDGAWDPVGPPTVDLTPGSTTPSSWASTATPADTTGSNPLVADMRVAIGSFIEAPVTATEDNTIEVSVIADHANGVSRVDFIANNGTPFSVSTEAVRDWQADPSLPNSACYTATLDLSAQTAGDPVEIRAIIYPIHGTPLVLQGDGTQSPALQDVDVSEGRNSVFFTKVSDTVDVSVTTERGLRAALNAQSFDQDKQYRFMLQSANSNWNDSLAVTVDTNPYVPVIVRGATAGRAISTFDVSCPLNPAGEVAQPNPLTGTNASGGLFFQFENLEINQSTTTFNQAASNGSIIKDCTITRNATPLTTFRGVTIGDNAAGNWDAPNQSVKTCVGATEWTRAQSNFNTVGTDVIPKDAVVFTTPAFVGNAVYLMESTVENNSNMGCGIVLQRNNIHQANLQDVGMAGTQLNLLVKDSVFGAQVIFTAGGGTIVWDVSTNGDFDSSATYTSGSEPYTVNQTVLAQDTTSANDNTPSPRWSVWQLYANAGGYYWGRSDPHVDIYQPNVSPPRVGVGSADPPTVTDGWLVVENTILQGWKATNVNLQYFIDTQWGSGSVSVVHNGHVWKDWTLEGQQYTSDTFRSRFFNSMYNWVWRDINYRPAGTQQYMGGLIIPQDMQGTENYADLASGSPDPSTDGATVQWAIIDSNLGNFSATVNTGMVQGDDLDTWITMVNNQPGNTSDIVQENSQAIYGSSPPSGTITVAGTPSVGGTLTASASVFNATSSSLQWSIADTETGTYTDIVGATSSSYTMVSADLGKFIKCTVTAVGIPPDLVKDSNISGPVGGGMMSLGGFSSTYVAVNPDPWTPVGLQTYPVTDDVGRVGIWGNLGRQGSFGNQAGILRWGPGYSDADDGTAGKGIYATDTYDFVDNRGPETVAWQASTPNGDAGKIFYETTVTQLDGTQLKSGLFAMFAGNDAFSGYQNVDESTFNNTAVYPFSNWDDGAEVRFDFYFEAD